MTANEHNRTLGILFLVYCGIQLFGIILSVVFGAIFAGVAMSELQNNEAFPVAIFAFAMIIALVLSAMFLAVTGIAGWKLLKEKPSARNWGIAASIIALLNIPLGTILGAYGLWFLFGEEGKNYYENFGQMWNYSPPPPNNWQ